MALPAFAAERRCLLHIVRGVLQSNDIISCPSGAQQQTRSSGVQRANDGWDRRTDRPIVTLLGILCG